MENDDERDKHAAAVHEAGHATVAAVLCWIHGRSQTVPLPEPVAGMSEVQIGGVVTEIRRTETSDPMYEKTWVGSTSHYRMDLDEPDKATINVAGMVAECHFDDEEVEAASIIEEWQFQVIEPSDTDYAGIPDSWDDRSAAVEGALTLLRDHRKLWKAVVAHLVQNEAISGGVLKDLVQQHR